jgi:predicted SnoaL-like aldol condensation-catalyzing enzyme
MTQPQYDKEVVLGFLRLAFTEKRPADAFAEYAGENYVQHNPHAPASDEDDLVCTHSLLRLTPGSRGSAVADVMRVRDGRIVEHWDVVQEVPETTASGNPMI